MSVLLLIFMVRLVDGQFDYYISKCDDRCFSPSHIGYIDDDSVTRLQNAISTNSPNAAKGKPGLDGIKGQKGEKGSPGVAVKGDIGKSGIKGQKGENGSPGIAMKGQKGEIGSTSNEIKGQKGENGSPGIGIKGSKGDTGACSCTRSVEREGIHEMENRIKELEHLVTRNIWNFVLSSSSDNKIVQEKITSCGVGARNGGGLKDESFTANNYAGAFYAPALGRLDKLDNMVSGGWLMRSPYNKDSWLQVDMQQTYKIVGVVTQGSGYLFYVKSYKIQYGVDSTSMKYILNQDGNAKVFKGNVDERNYAFSIFVDPITARYVRISPVTWIGRPQIRVEILKC